MSRSVRYKLSTEQFEVIEQVARQLQVPVDRLAKQSLLYAVSEMLQMQEPADAAATQEKAP